MLRQAVIRYNIRHAVINDNEFEFWRSQGVNCWPTVMVFSPDARPLFKTTGEGCEQDISALLQQGLQACVDQLESEETKDSDWVHHLTSSELPHQLEKDKQIEMQGRALGEGSAAATDVVIS